MQMRVSPAEPQEHRQILPIVMLMMLAILGMAAFAVDGSNVYSQHRRWQADLDVATKDAATQLNSGTTYTAALLQAMSSLTQALKQDGYPVSGSTTWNPITTSTIPGANCTGFNCGACISDQSGVTLCNPPISTPFQGLSYYVQGSISYTVPGFFGKVIGLGKMHINVQAVAKHTGSVTQSPYTILALDTIPPGGPGGQCPIEGNGGSGNNGSGLYVRGSVRSNDVNCSTGGFPYTVTGSSEMSGFSSAVGPVMTGTVGTYTGLNRTTDPYPPIALPPLAPSATIYTDATLATTTTCTQEVATYVPVTTTTQNNYYVFGDSSGRAVPFTWVSNGGGATPIGNYYFLPGCDGSPTGTVPGVFYFTGDVKNTTANQIINIESFSSTVVLPDADPTAANSGQFTYSNNAGVDSTFALQAPGLGSGAYTGIALTQLRTPDAATGQINCGSSYNGLSSISMQGGGTPNTPDYTIGIIDAPCTSFKAAGNSGYGNTSTTCTTPDIQGAIVVNDWQTSGHSVACVLYDSQAHSFTGGAVLVY